MLPAPKATHADDARRSQVPPPGSVHLPDELQSPRWARPMPVSWLLQLELLTRPRTSPLGCHAAASSTRRTGRSVPARLPPPATSPTLPPAAASSLNTEASTATEQDAVHIALTSFSRISHAPTSTHHRHSQKRGFARMDTRQRRKPAFACALGVTSCAWRYPTVTGDGLRRKAQALRD